MKKEERIQGDKPQRPEIVIGLVGPIGTPLKEVARRLATAFAPVGYHAEHIKLSSFLENLTGKGLPALKPSPEADRLRTYMARGTDVRTRTGHGDALAGLAIAHIRSLRETATGRDEEPNLNTVYILTSLKHEAEVKTLRRVYGPQFVAIGVHTSRDDRLQQVARRIGLSSGHPKADEVRSEAEKLIAIDEKEEKRPLGQNVRAAFPHCDYFINAASMAEVDKQLDRLVCILFSHPFVTPSVDEYGMFHAQASGRRSGALGRQVGAAITSGDGDVLAVGMNEVPKAGGGHYWEGDPGDARDYVLGFDQNDRMKRAAIREALLAMRDARWLCKEREEQAETDVDALIREALREDGPLHETLVANITEFGRDVHAEMSAIVTAARLGTKIGGAMLFTTTFPCHNCAKHIVASGIRRVVYVEPYAKSFAEDSHLDAISVDDPACSNGKISFERFCGVAPRNYMAWFQSLTRKDKEGEVISWDPTTSPPRFVFEDPGYIQREPRVVDDVYKKLAEKGISFDVTEEDTDDEKDEET